MKRIGSTRRDPGPQSRRRLQRQDRDRQGQGQSPPPLEARRRPLRGPLRRPAGRDRHCRATSAVGSEIAKGAGCGPRGLSRFLWPEATKIFFGVRQLVAAFPASSPTWAPCGVHFKIASQSCPRLGKSGDELPHSKGSLVCGLAFSNHDRDVPGLPAGFDVEAGDRDVLPDGAPLARPVAGCPWPPPVTGSAIALS